jgi:hypothetical protein
MQNTYTWGELAAMLTVSITIVTVINYLIAKLVVNPAIGKAVTDIKDWTEEKFPSRVEFAAHELHDSERFAEVHRDLIRIESKKGA